MKWIRYVTQMKEMRQLHKALGKKQGNSSFGNLRNLILKSFTIEQVMKAQRRSRGISVLFL
jgi:hypothetical protein